MNKAKTNALDALRALIAERQQYEQWIAGLEDKRAGTPEHVFERVQSDYRTRLEKVSAEIKGHSEELQLSISTLSSRLVEVAREEDTRRESLQEAELRAAVGEYDPEQWDKLRTESEQALAKIASDRESLDTQLGELRAIQKLGEITPGMVDGGQAAPDLIDLEGSVGSVSSEESGDSQLASEIPAPAEAPVVDSIIVSNPIAEEPKPETGSTAGGMGFGPPQETLRFGPDDGGRPTDAQTNGKVNDAPRQRSMKTPPRGTAAPLGSRNDAGKADAGKPGTGKTLKCPECGTPNNPTEWYCERCGGELATM